MKKHFKPIISVNTILSVDILGGRKGHFFIISIHAKAVKILAGLESTGSKSP